MSAGQWNAGLLTDGSSSFYYLLRNCGGYLFDRPAQDRDSDQWLTAHSIDIANGIGCRDLAERKRIVDQRREKVGTRDQCCAIAQIIDRRIVVRFITNSQCGILGPTDRGMQDLFEYARRDLATAAAAFVEFGEKGLGFDHGDKGGL